MILKISPLLIFTFFVTGMFAQTPEQTYFEWTSMPFSKTELAQRRADLIKQLRSQDTEGLVVIPARDGFSYGETFRQLDDFYYFTGLELPNSILVLDVAQDSAWIFAPERDLRFHSASRPNDFPGRPLLQDTTISVEAGLLLKTMADFSQLMNKASAAKGTILLNSGRQKEVSFPVEDYIATHTPEQVLINALQKKHPGLHYENCYKDIAALRMVKSKAEIELMRKSTAINVLGIRTAAKAIEPGIDERHLEGVLEGNYKINGAQRLAFGSIIKSGPNSLWPWRILATHYNRRNRVLETGDLVIFDVGCEYRNYVSDVGRTFPVSGKFTAKQKEILRMETGISDAIIAYIKPGITFTDLREFTHRIIPEHAKKYMQAGLFFGHHLGLSTGDPNLPQAKLRAGMIFTVEPWYYNHDEQISVFTEDVILVTEEGCEVLSKDLPRTPEELEQLMKE